MTTEISGPAVQGGVAHHYARIGQIEAIERGLAQMGKAIGTVTIDDLSAVDEFQIGGRKATERTDGAAPDHDCGLCSGCRYRAGRPGAPPRRPLPLPGQRDRSDTGLCRDWKSTMPMAGA